jgi:RNA polymerase sigma factor (TIGR02999 family)
MRSQGGQTVIRLPWAVARRSPTGRIDGPGYLGEASESVDDPCTNGRRSGIGRPPLYLTPTALVNEAWLKLSATPALGRLSQLEFKRVAARAMRQVLIEAARRRRAEKRGGGAGLVTFDESLNPGPTTSDELLDLHEALEALALVNPRQAALVESRFFGGLETAELAELLGISEATVLRDWRAARAWLALELSRSAGDR